MRRLLLCLIVFAACADRDREVTSAKLGDLEYAVPDGWTMRDVSEPASVATGERGYQNHRRHRYPGTHPVERGRFFAVAVPRRCEHELSVAPRS